MGVVFALGYLQTIQSLWGLLHIKHAAGTASGCREDLQLQQIIVASYMLKSRITRIMTGGHDEGEGQTVAVSEIKGQKTLVKN